MHKEQIRLLVDELMTVLQNYALVSVRDTLASEVVNRCFSVKLNTTVSRDNSLDARCASLRPYAWLTIGTVLIGEVCNNTIAVFSATAKSLVALKQTAEAVIFEP